MSAVAASAVVAGQVHVREMTSADAARWDSFVEECPGATFFHLAGWKTVIERAFNHRAFFLLAETGGNITGVLPLGHVKSMLFGNALISTPFCVYGGVAAVDDEARVALEARAESLAAELGVDYLEFRNRSIGRPDWLTKDLYVTFRKEIDADPDKNMQAIPRKQRAMVRKGIKAGLVGELDDGIDRLFAAYSESVRNLGTPVFPKKYFTVLQEVFAQRSEILTVTHSGQAVASVMSFYFRDEVLPYYGGSIAEARALKANDFMYWELMRRAGENGVRVFDYGRSKIGTGSWSFKKNWGFEAAPMPYQYHLVKAQDMPDINPLNPKYRIFSNLWRRLPVPVANVVGPMISRSLG